MSPDVIRPVLTEELPAVLSFWREVEVTPPSVTDSVEGLTILMQQPVALLLVATVDGKIVGSIIGGWDGWRGNIYHLAVAPAHRRKGIARRLVREISTALFEKGDAQRLSALVEYEHPWAMEFWSSVHDLGYVRDPRFARFIADRITGENQVDP
ncbi:MAG: GNAT family N-acetyltransferase [Deltaproteobacteria bacterium]|nr:GNAT family N-acetyltransferase [Deltaproteobacteria bacterium]